MQEQKKQKEQKKDGNSSRDLGKQISPKLSKMDISEHIEEIETDMLFYQNHFYNPNHIKILKR